MEVNIYSACGNIIGLSINPKPSFSPKEYLPHVDQLIIYNTPNVTIYNQDGSQAQQCCNGLRVLAYHLNKAHNTFYINNTPYYSNYIDNYHWITVQKPSHAPCKYLNIPYIQVNTGNLHAILDFKWLDSYNKLRPLLTTHNISFIAIDQNSIDIKTYERGVGYTESCGSAAISAAYIAHQKYPHVSTWYVKSQGGTLITKIGDSISQTGDVTQIDHIHI